MAGPQMDHPDARCHTPVPEIILHKSETSLWSKYSNYQDSSCGETDRATRRERVRKEGDHIFLRAASSRVSKLSSVVSVMMEPVWAYCARLIHYHRRLVALSVCLVALGVIAGVVIEGWGFLTALYVIVQISTTIGYGDVIAGSEWMKLFMTVYVLLNLLVVANFLNVLLNAVIERSQQNLFQKLMKFEVKANTSTLDDREARRRLGDMSNVLVSGMFFLASIVIGTVFYRFVENCTCSYGTTQVDFALQSCNPESFDTCVATGGLRHTWITAVYMSVITVTTVGFGDHTPKSFAGRVFSIFWMTIGVTLTGVFLSAVSKVLAHEPDSEITGVDGIDSDIFRLIDRDGDGFCTKAEFTRYVLVKHGFLPIEVLREIDAKYDAMDIDHTGRVSMATIEEAARRNQEAGGQTA